MKLTVVSDTSMSPFIQVHVPKQVSLITAAMAHLAKALLLTAIVILTATCSGIAVGMSLKIVLHSLIDWGVT